MKSIVIVTSFVLFLTTAIGAQTTAFAGVNVIPMDRERVVANQTVIVRSGVIAEICDVAKVKFVVKTPDEAREAVRKSKAAGYDFMQVTTFVPSLVYEVAVDEARMQKIRVVGHADSRFVGVERAWKARQQIEHLDGYVELLLKPDSPIKYSISDLYIYSPANWASLD